MKRVYISGAITGTDDYMERFAKAEGMLAKNGYGVINPARMEKILPESMTYEEHMEIDLLLLSKCDSIYLLRGWENSRGANREYGYALGRGMEIIMEE